MLVNILFTSTFLLSMILSFIAGYVWGVKETTRMYKALITKVTDGNAYKGNEFSLDDNVSKHNH